MSKMKKLAGLLVAMVMVLAMSLTVFAENKATETTITVPGTDSHTYEVYQIFTGELSEGVLSNVEWGKNGTGTEGTKVADDVMKALQDANKAEGANNTSKLAVIEQYVNLTSEKFGTVSKDAPLTVKTGYYLLKDVDANITGTDTFTKYVVQVVGPTTVNRKADAPEMEKKVKETNDTTGNVTDWQDASDYDIGDNVPYQIQTTIVANYGDYKTYYLAFNDTMDAGLTFNKDVKIYLGEDENGTDITSNFTITNADHGFKAEITNLKTIAAVQAGSKITVRYSAKLNKDAVIGSTGNKNTANMEFSNNPNSDQDGKPETPGKTPDDTVITFTYKTNVNKIDGATEKPLKGAGFTLFKKDKNGNYNAVGAEITGAEMTRFEFKGLDAGEYELRETTTPPGYNTAAPIQFTIASTFGTEDAEDNLELKKLTVTPADKFTVEMTEGDASYTGNIETKVENNKGSELPSTGGMGTTMFYIIGALCVACAGVLLISKKRVSR